jgi:hypothetical protein
MYCHWRLNGWVTRMSTKDKLEATLLFSSQNFCSFVKLTCLNISLLEYQNSDVRIKIKLPQESLRITAKCQQTVFSTVNAKCNGAERWGGIWLHSFLTLTIYGSGQHHTWSLYAWLKSPHYPMNAKLDGPRIWNERFRKKLNLLLPFRIQPRIPRMSNTQPIDSTDSFVLLYFAFIQSFLS